MKNTIDNRIFSLQNRIIRFGVKLPGLLVAFLVLLCSWQASGQGKGINLKVANASLESVLERVKQQTDTDLIFNHEALQSAPKVTIDIQGASITAILDKVLENSGFTYKKINDTIVITPVEIAVEEAPGIKQTLRGQVIDQVSKYPLSFATIHVLGTQPTKGTTSDLDGYFRIENLPVGRYTIKVSFVGYEDALVPEVLLGSGKETILTIALAESLTSLDALVVTANSGELLNEMAVVSGKSFDAEETKRYAASISDPARMAQVFAGVASTDDISNEIVIRGNSPNWMLWKLEGVEIPSPNHFAEEGYSAGAISILSANLLGSSDFYTGAFSADYGNALSGVFDLKLRNGNNQQYEHTFQAGLLGFDMASEGPFKKGYSGSYLFNYRYSTLSILNNLNVEVSENALPNYQDLSFKLNLPTEKAGTFSIWGIGGISDVFEKYLPDSTEKDFLDGYRDLTKTSMYASGITHTFFTDKQSYFETVLSSSESYSSEDSEEMDSLGNLRDEFYDKLNKKAIRFSSYYNRKINSRLSMRTGVILSRLNYDYASKELDESTGIWNTQVNSSGQTFLYQGYAMARYKFSERVTGSFGSHYTYFALNKDQALEPRLGLAFDLQNRQQITVGYGMHSRHENLPVYLVESQASDGSIQFLNKDLELTQAQHLVLGYSKMLNPKLQLKTELYYQYINNLPVANNPDKFGSPIFGGINPDDTLVSQGKGRNFGIEFTLQKYFSDQYYFMVTSSLFDSKYKPLDGNWYSTRYNINYINNIVGGKEWTLNKNRLLGLNAKLMWSGGKRQLPIDLEASREEGTTIYNEEVPWSFKTQDYIRLDLGLRMHFFKESREHVISLDIQNATNRLNTWTQIYDVDNDKVIDYPMAGLIPILSYRLEF